MTSTKRRCGDCTLCCRLLPIQSIGKPAGQRCKHQRHTGCMVHEDKPLPCAAWNCRWLSEDDTADVPRPDRSHCVIDMMRDIITVDQDGTSQTLEAVQIWCDPKHREAYRAPAVRAYIERRAREGIVTLVRFDASGDTVAVFAGPLSEDGGWHEHATRMNYQLLAERKLRFGY
jgi:hypothetical protein